MREKSERPFLSPGTPNRTVGTSPLLLCCLAECQCPVTTDKLQGVCAHNRNVGVACDLCLINTRKYCMAVSRIGKLIKPSIAKPLPSSISRVLHDRNISFKRMASQVTVTLKHLLNSSSYAPVTNQLPLLFVDKEYCHLKKSVHF